MTTTDQSQPDFVKVLAINISSRFSEGDDVRAVTAEGWKIRQRDVDAVMSDFGDFVVAVVDDVIKEVFKVDGWSLDPNAGGTMVFELTPAPEWRHVIGDRRFSWKPREDAVKKVRLLRDRPQPPHDPRAGWHLDIAGDGKSATVRGPGQLAVTGGVDGQLCVTLLPKS